MMQLQIRLVVKRQSARGRLLACSVLFAFLIWGPFDFVPSLVPARAHTVARSQSAAEKDPNCHCSICHTATPCCCKLGSAPAQTACYKQGCETPKQADVAVKVRPPIILVSSVTRLVTPDAYHDFAYVPDTLISASLQTHSPPPRFS